MGRLSVLDYCAQLQGEDLSRSARALGQSSIRQLRLGDFARAQAASTDAHFLAVAALYLGLHRVQIHIPAALGDVVRVRDVVAELRTFAADFTNP